MAKPEVLFLLPTIAKEGCSFFSASSSLKGIHDLMYLDLLPKLNIYRPDLIPSDLSVSQYHTLNVAAVLLSHVHMDLCGNNGMLRKDIPVLASFLISHEAPAHRYSPGLNVAG